MTLGVALLLVAAVVAVAAVTGWFSWTAGRLDRMHLRCEGARAALETSLAHRRALAIELSGDPAIDPASAVLLAAAATGTTAVDGGERWQRESDLSEVVRAIAPGAAASDVWDELVAVTRRVALARRIHNDLVATTRALRSRRRVHWFRLAGRAPEPAMIAFDDEAPDHGEAF